MAATSAISFLPETFLDWPLTCSTTASTALSMPRFSAIGSAPAARALRPSLKIASARTVAVVVPSPAASEVLRGGLLDELGAHVLVRVGQLDLLGHGHAVLGDGRAAPALVDHGVAAARARACSGRPGPAWSRRSPASGGPPHRRPTSSPRWILLRRGRESSTTPHGSQTPREWIGCRNLPSDPLTSARNATCIPPPIGFPLQFLFRIACDKSPGKGATCILPLWQPS